MVTNESFFKWNVNPKKKSKLIDTILKKFKAECSKSKDPIINKRVIFFNDDKISQANYNIAYKGDYKTNKLRRILVGTYDFRAPKAENTYNEFRAIISKVNGEVNGIEIKLTISEEDIKALTDGFGYDNGMGGAVMIGNIAKGGFDITKAGCMVLSIKKDAIKESLCSNGSDFVNEIMNDLF